MCGFAAVLPGNKGLKTDTSIVHSMINAIAHRGPDERGFKECAVIKLFLVIVGCPSLISMQDSSQQLTGRIGIVWFSMVKSIIIKNSNLN